jgi:hypothetical protein
MPAPYGKRTLVWVIPFTGSTLKYGFKTNADGAAQTVLGHTVVDLAAAMPTGLVIGANAPKPPRAVRKRTTGSESSYCAAGNIDDAKAAGWSVSPGRVRRGSSSTLSKTVYVLHEGNKLAWKMPLWAYNRISTDFAGLGIVDATAAAKDLVFGVSYPVLPRVKKMILNGTTFSSSSTFCDPSKLDALPAGWATTKASEDAF